jgi:nicotinamidase-related amidase
MSKKNNKLAEEIGFFDIDSRELGKDGCGLEFRERVLPIADKLNILYDFAYKYQLMIVFTTCCSENFLKENSLDYVRYVPLDEKDSSWAKNDENYRYFYIQKKQYGKPRINCESSAYNFFKYNGNAIKLFKKLKIKKWVVFGNGFDSCVNLACLRLLEEKFKLIVLEDAVAPAYGPGKIGTEGNKKKILKELRDKGAETMALKNFLEKYSSLKTA